MSFYSFQNKNNMEETKMTKNKIAKLFLILMAFIFLFSLIGCAAPQDVLGTYSSDNNGSITITAFDGEDGEFIADKIVLPRLNNGNSYSTDSKDVELFTVYRQSGKVYSFRASVDGVAYIGTFDASNDTITIENVVYTVTK